MMELEFEVCGRSKVRASVPPGRVSEKVPFTRSDRQLTTRATQHNTTQRTQEGSIANAEKSDIRWDKAEDGGIKQSIQPASLSSPGARNQSKQA
jgi:hypothetical protein